MKIIFGLLVGMMFSAQAFALDLGSLSNADAVSGLKDALTQGTSAAVSQLGVTDGFLGNAKVKIPLPDALKRVESGLRMFGMQKQARIESYVTQKALDGLFLMIAEQEQAIRKDPVGAATGMAQKVFGLLGR